MGWFSNKDDDFFLATIVPSLSDGGPRIAKYLGIVNGEAIIGANIFRDLFSSVRDVVGGRAGGYERALSGARDAALDDMKAAAKELGANGVVGNRLRLRSARRGQRDDDGGGEWDGGVDGRLTTRQAFTEHVRQHLIQRHLTPHRPRPIRARREADAHSFRPLHHPFRHRPIGGDFA